MLFGIDFQWGRLIRLRSKLLFLQRCVGNVLLLFALSSHAQPARYFFDSIEFPVPHGKHIQKIVTDQSSHIWLSSDGSYIQRYNGEGAVSSFYFEYDLVKIDSIGRIWDVTFYHDDHSFSYFDTASGQKGNVIPVDENNNLLQVGGDYLLGVHQNTLYFVAKSGILYSAKLTKTLPRSLIFKVETKFDSILTTPSHIIPELEVDGYNKVWLSLGPRILRYDPASQRTTDFSFLVKKNVLNNKGLITAVTDASVTWLNIHYTGELFRIDRNDRVKPFSIAYRINDIEFDKLRNILWIASENGLFYVEGDSEVVQHYAPELRQKSGLASPSIYTLSFDKNNNLWVTSSDGVQLIRGIHQHVQRIVPELSWGGNVIDSRRQAIRGLTAQSKEVLWWVNHVNELVRYDTQTGKEQPFPIVFPNPLLFNQAKSIAYSPPYILLSTRSGYLLKFNTKTQQFDSPDILDKTLHSFIFKPHNRGDQQFVYFEGYLSHPKGTPHINKYEFQRWKPAINTVESVFCEVRNKSDHDISSILYFDNSFLYNNTLWITNRINGGNNIIKASSDLSHCENFFVPFENNEIYAVSQIDPDTLWLIHGNYIRQMNIKTKQLLYEQLLPLQAIDHVVVDQDSNFLVYGDNALWRYNIIQKRWHPLFAAEVQQDAKSGFFAFFDIDRGVFYILSHQGIVAIDTHKQINIDQSRLSFTSLTVGEKKHTLFESSSQLDIPYAQAIEIGFITTPIMPSKLLRYRYRLAKDQPWVIVNNNEKLLFTLLPHGKYALEMQVTFSHQDFGNSEFLHFTILPPWWHTTLAYTVYFTLFGMLLALLIHWMNTRKHLREAKVNALKQQQKRLSALELLAGGIVHDINNALFEISGSAELVALKDKDRLFSKYIETILTVIKDTKKLTNKLLSFAKKGGTSSAVINVHDLIDDTFEIMKQSYGSRITLKKKYTASVPYIECDVSEMKNALLNIIRNAYQAINMEQGKIEVGTTNRRHINGEVDNEGNLLPEQSVVISIVDNGCGISKSMLNQIIEPFVTTRSHTGGTGLGLSVVYGTLKQHNGSININSKLKRGTQVTLFLPTSTPIETATPVKTSPSTHFDNKCILLCDDNKQLQRIVKEMLCSLGITVLLADNGQKCLDIVQTREETIDLVILDDVMPVMGGRECFYELKMRHPALSVIMITGYRAKSETDQLLKDGLLGIYKKPMEFDALIKVLSKIFS